MLLKSFQDLGLLTPYLSQEYSSPIPKKTHKNLPQIDGQSGLKGKFQDRLETK